MDVLVFRFDGGSPSQFHVLILDNSCTEIDYPLRCSCNDKKRKIDCKDLIADTMDDDDNDDDDDVSVEMLDKFAPKSKQTESIADLDSSDSDISKCSTSKRGIWQYPSYYA